MDLDKACIFNEIVFAECVELINVQYYDFAEEDLQLWLKNFNGVREKTVACIALHRMTYRNKKSKKSLYDNILHILLPKVLEEENIYSIESIESFISDLRNAKLSCLKFSTIEDNNNPAKSGNALLRDFERETGVHKNMLTSSNSFYKDTKAIIFIDDMLGTGEQFKKLLNKINNKNIKVIYLPLVAYEGTLLKLKRENLSIRVEAVEIIKEENTFKSMDGIENILLELDVKKQELLEIYETIMSRTRLAKKNIYGRNGQAFMHFFDNSSPNNSLPLFTYSNDKDAWNNLFKR